MSDPNAVPKPRITLDGHVYVSTAAAQSYAQIEGIEPEQARRELTILLLEAHWTRPLSGNAPGHARARDRALGADVTVTIAKEGRLLVVLSVSVRNLHRSRRVPERRIAALRRGGQ